MIDYSLTVNLYEPPPPLPPHKSFQTGTFPEKIKIAKVIPIYKSGDKKI